MVYAAAFSLAQSPFFWFGGEHGVNDQTISNHLPSRSWKPRTMYMEETDLPWLLFDNCWKGLKLNTIIPI